MSSLAAEYRKKLTTPDEAVRAVKSGDWVDYGHFASQAVALDEALARRRDELTDVKIRSMGRCVGPAAVVRADPKREHFTLHSFHFSGIDRRAFDAGACFFVPILYHEVPRYYREHLEVDVAFVPVTPMDADGNFNFSVSCSHARAVCDRARRIVLEVNPRLPRCLGPRETTVHLSEVDAVVEAEWALPQVPAAEPSPVPEAMAAMIVERLRDGCCLQLGIGALPAAIGRLIARSGLRDLGIHTEMFTDAFIDVIEAGHVTGARKPIDRGQVVYTFAAGTDRMYRWLDGNAGCATYPVDYTNDPCVIRQLDDMVAINSCLEIDLYGQVSSESAAGRRDQRHRRPGGLHRGRLRRPARPGLPLHRGHPRRPRHAPLPHRAAPGAGHRGHHAAHGGLAGGDRVRGGEPQGQVHLGAGRGADRPGRPALPRGARSARRRGWGSGGAGAAELRGAHRSPWASRRPSGTERGPRWLALSANRPWRRALPPRADLARRGLAPGERVATDRVRRRGRPGPLDDASVLTDT
ncbi:MAG: acetyl-CoA hydrolase/transferase C-terminal domain-containing protein [Anaeromyxobacter sp.]